MSANSGSSRIVWWFDPYSAKDTLDAHCCSLMRKMLARTEPETAPNDNPMLLVGYSAITREYGLVLRDADIAQLELINNCPWCGVTLPAGLRDEFFDVLEELGHENPLSDWDAIPEKFKSAEWWKEKNL